MARVAGAVLTYIGGTLTCIMGLSLLFDAHNGTYMGHPTDAVRISGAPIPIGVASAAGGVFAVIGLALIMLTVAAQRGHSFGYIGLTVIGALVIAGLIYTFLFADRISPIPSSAWIVIALTLLWFGKRSKQKQPGATPRQG